MDLDRFKRNNKFLLLAFDHRGSFKKLINSDNPDSVSDEQAVELKRAIIESVYDQFSGVLIDKDIGLRAYERKSKPFLLPIEKSGYTEKLGERLVELEYSASDLKKLGASGAKILLYFNPDVESAKTQLEIAKKVVEDCRENNLPLFLEIRVYMPDTGDKLGSNQERLVIDSLTRFLEEGVEPDVWKLEYPGTLTDCQRLTVIAGKTPWILLTRGVGFDEFVIQLEDAIKAGAQGFLAGRALWQEVCKMGGERKIEFLAKTLPERFRKICKIAEGVN